MPTYVLLSNIPTQIQDSVTSLNMSGGTMEFYLAGTTTPTNLFSDEIGTSIGTSISLNSGGYPQSGGNIVNLYYDAEIDIKIIIRDAAGGEIVTVDPIQSPLSWLTASLLGQIIKPQTPEELAAGIAIVDYQRDPGDIRRYGADGTPADIAAINSAASISHLHPMYIPATDTFWQHTGNINLPDEDGVTIIGDGDKSVIRITTASADGIRNGTGNRQFNYTFRDFRIGVDGAISGGTGIDLEDVSNSFFSNVKVIADDTSQGFRVGWRLFTSVGGGCFRNEFESCSVRTDVNASARGVLISGGSEQSSNSHHIRGGEVRADSGIGVFIERSGVTAAGISTQNTIDQVSFEGTTATGVSIEGGSSVAQFNQVQLCRFEGPTAGISMDANTVANGTFMNFFSTGVTTPISDSGENFTFEPAPHTSVDSKFIVGRGHYEVANLRDTAVPAFSAPLQNVAHPAFGTQVAGDTNLRIEIRADGQVEWGPGDGASDVSLDRVAVGVLGFNAGNFAVPSYTVATLPAVTQAGQVIYVSDETGGAILAFSDGTNFRRVSDRAIVS